ncbi:GAF domain-containing protein [Novosphingobium sp.]|uniref:GAF domain-containing protein n=1 Tax=Novosphingobium sp. TaxID=1874826 RepID=UPI0025CE7949|nr:GAF domain-containing protein [Novosphingobium sp.]
MKAITHGEELRRLAALRSFAVLDTAADADFNAITDLVAQICQTPIALVSLVDEHRQWFKARTNFHETETPRSQSICARVMHEGGLVEIPDTHLDPRTNDNPLCLAEDGIRFYAGAPLVAEDGAVLGMLCVVDHQPRRISQLQRQTLLAMARQVMVLLELRRNVEQLQTLRREIDHRVKNSLASVMAGVRTLQRRAASDDARMALDAVSAKLIALTALHEELYLGSDSMRIDLARFLHRLAAPLSDLMPRGVKLEVQADSLEVSPSEANLIGLVVNEFATNSGKYAFEEDCGGTIMVTGRRDGHAYTVVCRDNGCADAATLMQTEVSDGLGMRVIRASLSSLGSKAHWSLASPGLQLRFDFSVMGTQDLA